MKTLKDYLKEYETAMAGQSEETKRVFRPELWILQKWCYDEKIEEFSDPMFEKKLNQLDDSNSDLADVLWAGVEISLEVFGIFNLGIAAKRTRGKQ